MLGVAFGSIALMKSYLTPPGISLTIRVSRTVRKNRVTEDLLRFWIGHAGKSVTDGYSMVKSDVEFRQLCATDVGLDFRFLPKKTLSCTQLHPE